MAYNLLQHKENEIDEMEEDSVSDDDDLEQQESRKGSRVGRKNYPRDFQAVHQQLIQDYFCDNPTYKEYQFERRFGKPRVIFNRIFDELKHTENFRHKYNPVTRSLGIYTRVQFCAALQLLVSREPFDSVDQSFKMGETAAVKAMKSFCQLVIAKFGDQYLNRYPTTEKKSAVMQLMKMPGFPKAFASWDCKHFVCPMA